jgi:hemerythrin
VSNLIWTSNFNTGIDVVDNQHKRIVDMINLLRAARRRGNTEAIGAVIDDLIDYTMSHFAFEEAMMEDAGYALAHAHKRVHDLLVRHVNECRRRFRDGEDITDELNGLLSRWLFDHILHHDAAYADPVKARLRELVRDRREGGWLSRSLKQFFTAGSTEYRV